MEDALLTPRSNHRLTLFLALFPVFAWGLTALDEQSGSTQDQQTSKLEAPALRHRCRTRVPSQKLLHRVQPQPIREQIVLKANRPAACFG
jgi:hypothetical protein